MISYKFFVGYIVGLNSVDEIADVFNKYPKYANMFVANHIAMKKEVPKNIWNTFDMDRYFRAADIASKR